MNSLAEIIEKNDRVNNKVKIQLGTLLLAHMLIMPQDLEFALEHQKFSNQLLGEILVRIGALEPDDLDRILRLQCSI
ncbi:MAG TPA: hypothetical protein VL122_10615 [Nitrospirota bacterium]|nr:hypothetical protein [Nitrospirota bacterium]